MDNAHLFREKLAAGQTLLGTCITFFDPTVTEALSNLLDFVWIDTEHSPMSLERVQGHLLATTGTQAVPLVRVPANDPVLIKPVLDIGAAGVIVPLVRTADDVRLAVAACRYPPEGVRGFGPRRPIHYGARGGPEYCQLANREIITIVQIEQREALENLDEILAVPGLTSIVVGPNDLAASLGFTGQPCHAEVVSAIDTIIARSRSAGVPMGLAFGDDPEALAEWIDKGVNWLSIAGDFVFLMRRAEQLTSQLREHVRSKS